MLIRGAPDWRHVFKAKGAIMPNSREAIIALWTTDAQVDG